MRTMLISLILFCSLTQFAIADDPPPAGWKINEKLEGCGGNKAVYQCYMPEVCTKYTLAGKTVDKGSVEKVDSTTIVDPDCPALIRFHLFTKLWAYVSIESFKDVTKIQTIKFFQHRTIDPVGKRNEFSCEYGDTPTDPEKKLRARHSNNPTSNNIKNEEEPDSANTFLCTFEVTVKTEKLAVFGGDVNDEVTFEVDSAKTLKFEHELRDFTNCDPRQIEYTTNEDEKQKYMYEPIQYTPLKISCENPAKYKLQVRKPGGKYETAAIKCTAGKLFINSDPDPVLHVDARCAAEVKYFCDYPVKTTEGIPPERTPPNLAANVPSALKCKNEKYLIVEGKLAPDYKFECLYYGGSDPYWTVTVNGETKILHKEGPEVHCTNTLECHKIFRISDSSVESGELGADYLPKCFRGGKLHVNDKEVKDKRCDESTGEFKYTDDVGQHVIDAQTKFVCDYPEVRNEKKNAENVAEIATKTVAICGSFVAVIGLIVAGISVWACMRIRKEKKKNDAVNRVAWMKYCASSDEKDAEKARLLEEKLKREKKNKNKKGQEDKKDKTQSQSSEGEAAQFCSWNTMIMYLQNRGIYDLLKDDAKPETEQEISDLVMSKLNKKGKVLDKSVLPTYEFEEDTKKPMYNYNPAILAACSSAFTDAVKGEEPLRVERREKAKNKEKNAKAKK